MAGRKTAARAKRRRARPTASGRPSAGRTPAKGELASELGQRLNRAVEVTVAERDAADPDGDGRSRNRHDYETEEEA